MGTSLIDRLASISKLSGIPRKELKWLVEHGQFEVYEPGTVIGPKGKRVDYLWIIVSGKIAIRVDRGVGPRLVTEWDTGEVSGMLPYSRMSGPPGDNYIGERAELLAVPVKLFPQMIINCPAFTAYTVHKMLDRARNFNTSDLQDEKMISLGKMSAGLAHELNNPASAAVRDAKQILSGLDDLNNASRAIGGAGLTEEQFKMIDDIRLSYLGKSDSRLLSPIQRADQEDKISEWLEIRQLNSDLAVHLADTGITIDQLDTLAIEMPEKVIDVALRWLVASWTTQTVTIDIGQAVTQIYRVVDAVKKFTYMDHVSDKEMVDVEPGIRDTLCILLGKTKSKNAKINLEIDPEVPRVYANGSDLNQVWFSLLDNALDAIAESGTICVESRSELNRVVIEIVDDGPGIAPEVISKVFDPFFTTKAPGKGTGLGLDMTRRLLRRYHGDISVHSQPGRTEFRVSLLHHEPEMGKDQ